MKNIRWLIMLVVVVYSILLNATENLNSDDQSLSKDAVRQSIEKTLDVLNEVYVYPKKAKDIQTEILKRMNNGAYDDIKTIKSFASKITDEFINVSRDGHLGIRLVKKGVKSTHVIEPTEDFRKNNYAFQKLEVLSGNVGYMKFNKFHQDAAARLTVDSAFEFLSKTDAMIIDLRDNIGGSPELVQYMLSHFFSKKELLWSSHGRDEKEVYYNFSIKGVGSKKFKTNYPIFLLVGPHTASAAEIFSYTLKHLSKATVIGERTMGIAHGVSAVPINQYFYGRFSMSRPLNPITNNNWELVGVIPNIESTSKKSLEIAHAKALETLKL